ncbi:MAG: imidazoleglycerol-phosphate dehydratase HisB [Planctomycetes bacterium]|nr:imidazoleglycerol-phosphate dehydratase HisB [Planctomycetota bacterium]
MEKRIGTVERKTGETQISIELNLDGSGKCQIVTGVDFFDHMLHLLGKHGLFDLKIEALGDVGVDAHHTVEDVGICLGQALAKAVGNKKGIARYGFFLLPMDESLARVVLDLSGRGHLEWRAKISAEKCGTFDTCLGKEFMRAFAVQGGVNMHVDLVACGDPHHELEAIFKGLGRALRAAVALDPREKGVPSSKGLL